MASVWLLSVLLLYCIVHAKSDECVAYNFEYDVESIFFNDTGICERALYGMSAWNVGSYSEIGIESLHPESASFVTPTSSFSCGSTFEFPMTVGGIVEVNVYMEINSTSDYITVSAMQALSDGNDPVVGSVKMHAFDANYVNGWQSLRMELIGIGSFQGYITIMGTASAESLVLVDSFRYIPPSADKNSCLIYGDNTETIAKPTTEPTTDTYIQPTTTQQNNPIEECVAYNFESDFDVRFNTDNYLCNGLRSWQLDNYTSVGIKSLNQGSTVFMTPNEIPSCISSFVFKMEPDGIVEATVFMEPAEALDHIIIIAQRVTGDEYDTVAGFIKYHPGNEEFVPGWNVIRFTLVDLTSFDGYLIFIGGADRNSTVFVDSVRYIPPLTPPEDSSCNLY